MLANSSLSFKISLQLFSASLPVQLTSSYNDSRLHNTCYYTFTPYFYSYHSKYSMHFPALVFVHLFFFTRTPTFQIFCHYTAATPLHHILISHSYKLPVLCFLPTSSSISPMSGEGGLGNWKLCAAQKVLDWSCRICNCWYFSLP